MTAVLASVFLAILLLLSACANNPVTRTKPAVVIDSATRAEVINHYQTIAWQARAHATSKGKALQFYLHWQQTGERFTGSGYSLVGSQLFALEGDAHTVTYQATGKAAQRLSSEQIIEQLTGLTLNPAQLFALVTAIPLQQATTSWNGQQLTSQAIDNIEVQYLSWQVWDDLTMPRRIRIQNSDSILALVFTEWNFFATQLAPNNTNWLQSRRQSSLNPGIHL